jgi:hypothetical protein
MMQVYVCDSESPQAKAVVALLSFEGWSYEVVQDPAYVLTALRGRCSPADGVAVVYKGETFGGFWPLVRWLEYKGLVRI